MTKGKQWIRLNKGLELLDTPGILWPKFEDQQVGMRLPFIGSMNDEILIPDELACDLIGAIKELLSEGFAGTLRGRSCGKAHRDTGSSGREPQMLCKGRTTGSGESRRHPDR